MVAFQLAYQGDVILSASRQFPLMKSRSDFVRAFRLASLLSSARIIAYSLIRAPHISQWLICSTAPRGMISPSKSAEINSAACSQFMICFSFLGACCARLFVIVLVPQKAVTAQCPPGCPRFQQVPRKTALQLRAAKGWIVVQRLAVQMRR